MTANASRTTETGIWVGFEPLTPDAKVKSIPNKPPINREILPISPLAEAMTGYFEYVRRNLNIPIKNVNTTS